MTIHYNSGISSGVNGSADYIHIHTLGYRTGYNTSVYVYNSNEITM